MFYAKSKLENGLTVEIKLTESNIFTRCAECGVEMQESPSEWINDFFQNGGSVFGDEVRKYCPKCYAKRYERKNQTDKENRSEV